MVQMYNSNRSLGYRCTAARAARTVSVCDTRGGAARCEHTKAMCTHTLTIYVTTLHQDFTARV
jgi:hypothetical protein